MALSFDEKFETPFYRLMKYNDQFILEVVLELSNDDWCSSVKTKELAASKNIESVYACMRLFKVQSYHDWTIGRPHWDMPFSLFKS